MNTKRYVGFVGVVIVVALGVMFFTGKGPLPSSQKGAGDFAKENNEAEIPRILTNKQTPYFEFSNEEYQKAVSSGKIIYLEFYANWCPICRAQEPDLIEGFDQLTRTDVAGFRVNFKDDQTDEDEKALAAKYKIPYQHHKIVLKGGQVVIDSADTWDAQTLVSELSNL